MIRRNAAQTARAQQAIARSLASRDFGLVERFSAGREVPVAIRNGRSPGYLGSAALPERFDGGQGFDARAWFLHTFGWLS